MNPRVLSWARDASGLNHDEAAKRLQVKPERLLEWESGDLEPTVVQLRKLAQVYDRTPAFFFLSETPATDFPAPPDYRSPEQHSRPSYALLRQLRECVQRRDTLMELEGLAEPFQLSNFASLGPQEAAAAVRAHLGVYVDDQRRTRGVYQMLALWTSAVESAGALVFQSSKFPIEEARGVSVHFPEWPVILLNSKDAPAGRIFTLFHEIFHLIRGGGGLCELADDVAEERRCNRFAAELLMPSHVLAEVSPNEGVDAVRRLARTLKVSKMAMAVRLLQLGLLEQSAFDEIRRETELAVSKRDGGDNPLIPYFRLRLCDVGRKYATAVLDAQSRDEITLAHASRLIGTKVQHLEKMEEALQNSSHAST